MVSVLFLSLRGVTLLVRVEIDTVGAGRVQKSRAAGFLFGNCSTELAISSAHALLQSSVGFIELLGDPWNAWKDLHPVFVSAEMLEVTSSPHLSAGVPIYFPGDPPKISG